jgi:hypothetical protein
MAGRIIVEAATLTVDTGTTGVLDTDADAAIVDVSSLENISIYLNQITDNGNVTLTVEKTIDGTNFAPVDVIDQSELPAGANKSKELTLSDANGMPLRAKMIRVVVSSKTGTGTYSMTVAGSQVPGFR